VHVCCIIFNKVSVSVSIIHCQMPTGRQLGLRSSFQRLTETSGLASSLSAASSTYWPSIPDLIVQWPGPENFVVCTFCVQHAKLTHCLPKNAKNGHFHFFSYSLTYATQTSAKVPNTDFCHIRDRQAYKSRHLKYFGTL